MNLCYNHLAALTAADDDGLTGAETSHNPSKPMTTTACIIATIIAALLLPALFLAWVFETRTDRARRWRAAGLSQQRIADRLGCSRHTVRRMLAAA